MGRLAYRIFLLKMQHACIVLEPILPHGLGTKGQGLGKGVGYYYSPPQRVIYKQEHKVTLRTMESSI